MGGLPMDKEEVVSKNFIEKIIDQDLAEGKINVPRIISYGAVVFTSRRENQFLSGLFVKKGSAVWPREGALGAGRCFGGESRREDSPFRRMIGHLDFHRSSIHNILMVKEWNV